MNALVRFFILGAADADARVARALAPRRLDQADRYLRESRAGQFLDRATLLAESLWHTSASGRAATEMIRDWRGRDWPARHGPLGVMLLIAAATHMLLTLAQGLRPGWYWAVIPALAVLFGVLLLAASRSVGSTR